MKLCECGCGEPAPISKRNRYDLGFVKGQPIRFIRGHNYNQLPLKKGEDNGMWKGGKVDRKGYVGIKQKSGRYKLEHIIIAEKALGKPLPVHAVVHHHNGIKSENQNSNLVVCENNAYHLHLHKRQRAFERGQL